MMPKRILLVDDEELITRTLVKTLEKKGYDVMVAKNGEDAIAMAEAEDFNLIISDIRMPGKNGVDTVKEIMALIKNKRQEKIPSIFVTGYTDQDAETEAQRLKPNAFLFKPFDLTVFLSEVEKAIA